MPESERRKQERFPLALPAVVAANGFKGGEALKLRTRDLSSAGAFLESSDLIPEGTEVRIELLLSVKSLLEVIGAETGASVHLRGRVVRIACGGFAVEFARGFRIRPARRKVEGWSLR